MKRDIGGSNLQPGEEERLLQHASPHLKVLIVAALATAMRREEILSLVWRDVECDAKGHPLRIHLQPKNTKTGRARVVPVSTTLRAVLEMRRTGPDGKELGPDAYVFGDETGTMRQDSIKSAWRTCCRKAGITNLRFHDLRHEAASRLLQSGRFTLLDLQALLGHADLTTTSIYLNAREGDVVKAMQAFDEHQRQLARAAKAAAKRTARRKSNAPREAVH